jgi:long-subunit fatty acid transport protein
MSILPALGRKRLYKSSPKTIPGQTPMPTHSKRVHRMTRWVPNLYIQMPNISFFNFSISFYESLGNNASLSPGQSHPTNLSSITIEVRSSLAVEVHSFPR